MEGLARLDSDDKVAQFIGLVGVLVTNRKMIDLFFVVNLVIIGGGKKDYFKKYDNPGGIHEDIRKKSSNIPEEVRKWRRRQKERWGKPDLQESGVLHLCNVM